MGAERALAAGRGYCGHQSQWLFRAEALLSKLLKLERMLPAPLQMDTVEHVRWLFDRVKALLGPRLQVRTPPLLCCPG